MESIESLKNEIASLRERLRKTTCLERPGKADIGSKFIEPDSEVRFRTVFEASPVGNKIISADLKILEVNPAMVALLGYDSKDEIIGTRILDYSPLEFHQHWKNLQDNLWNRSSPSFTLETRLQKKDGTLIWCNVNSILFQDKEKTLGFTLIENITVKRELRLHKDEFINVASHELKTPLTSLKAIIQLLNRKINNDPVISDKTRALAEDADHYVGKLAHLVDSLLNTTRIGERELQLVKSEFSLKDLIENCCKHIRFNELHQITHTGDLSGVLYADRNRLDQVIVNFVNNAVKYAPNSFEIAIHVEDLKDRVKISVSDKGEGISPEYIPYLFNRYYRINQNDDQRSGLGLGLYISAEIIRKHGGKIGVDSEPGKGATFWLNIPKG